MNKSSIDIKAVFFDFDDTIIDVEERLIEAAFRLAHLNGINVSKRAIKDIFNFRKDWREVLRSLGISLEKDVLTQYINFFMESYSLSRLKLGVKRVLNNFRKRFKILLVTSRESQVQVEKELRELGIREFFHHIVTREYAAKYFGLTELPLYPFNQQRTILYQCALQLSETSPNQVVVVGDSPRELIPAKTLGMLPVAVQTNINGRSDLEKITPYIITNIDELDRLDIFHHGG